jgi:hypothetical protein
MCRQKLRNEVPEAGKPALSCNPSMATTFPMATDFFRSPKRCFARQRACDLSARRLLTAVSVNGRRTVVRPLWTARSTRVADAAALGLSLRALRIWRASLEDSGNGMD